MDLDRPNVRDHLAFARGIHVCPGKPIALAEIRAALEHLFRRLPDMRLADGYEPLYIASYFFRGSSVSTSRGDCRRDHRSISHCGSRSRWSGMKLEVKIKLTTCRLQDGRYPLTPASTSHAGYLLDIRNHTTDHEATRPRVINRVTRL